MSKKEENLKALMDFKNSLESEKVLREVENAKITNPTKEIEESLVSFLKTRLARVEKDSEFSDLIKMHIRQRLPEFSIDQLLSLNEQVTRNTNKSVEGITPLFIGDTNSKTVIDHVKNNSSAENSAQVLYNSNATNRDVLQAVTYLSSVVSKLSKDNDKVEVISED